jgi:DNA-directed RNA polymerase I subunit RPA2
MERDALIAHGTSFLLQDRLMNCSDYSTAWVCRTCGSLISLGYEDVDLGGDSLRMGLAQPGGEYCRVCRAGEEEKAERERAAMGSESTNTGQNGIGGGVNGVRVALPSGNVLGGGKGGGDLDVVAVPYVFRYLCAELASMGIAVSLEVQ